MLDYNFINSEEELLNVIRTGTATFEDYKAVVEKVQNINYTDCNDVGFLHDAIREKKLDVALYISCLIFAHVHVYTFCYIKT